MNSTQTIRYKLSTIFLAINFVIAASVINLGSPHTAKAAFGAPDKNKFDTTVGDFYAIEDEETLAKTNPETGEVVFRRSFDLDGEKLVGFDAFGIKRDPDREALIGSLFFGITDKGNIYELDQTGFESKQRLLGQIPPQFVEGEIEMEVDPESRKVLIIRGNRIIKFNPNNKQFDISNNLSYKPGDKNAGKQAAVKGLAFDKNSQLFGIDPINSALVKVDDAVGGLLQTIADINIGIQTLNGFDISQLTNNALASIVSPGKTSASIFSFNLETGQASKLAELEPSLKGFASVPKELSPATCVIESPSATNPVGSEHSVKVRAFLDGTEMTDADSLAIAVTSGPNSGAQGNTSQFAYRSNGQTGTDIIKATGSIGDSTFECTATKKWVQGPMIFDVSKKGKKLDVFGVFNEGDKIIVDGKQQNTKNNSSDPTGRLTAKKGGKGIEDGAEVKVSGSNAESEEFILGKSVSDLDCGLTPPSAKVKVGTEITLTLTVYAKGELTAEASLATFNVIVGPNADIRNRNVLGSNGTFAFSYTSSKPGLDIIQVTGKVRDQTFTCGAVVEWIP